jgi:protein ImuB
MALGRSPVEGAVQQGAEKKKKSEDRRQKPEEVASRANPEPRAPSPESRVPSPEGLAPALRRFRLPIPARVLIDGDRPVSVRTDRTALAGGRVHAVAGPWRTSGEWWKTAAATAGAQPSSPPRRAGWNRDEWDVALSDGGLYRIFEDRDTGRWFVGAVVD